MNKELVKKELVSWMKYLIPALLVVFILNTKIIVNATVPTGSMEGTISAGDRVIGNRLAYLTAKPERGDVIVFLFPDDESQNYLKRIIGLPGEQVEIIDGLVYINNSPVPLAETYLEVVPEGSYGPFKIPADSYFVMGDNRNNSFDSRLWKNSYVHKDKILAKVLWDYFPSFHSVE